MADGSTLGLPENAVWQAGRDVETGRGFTPVVSGSRLSGGLTDVSESVLGHTNSHTFYAFMACYQTSICRRHHRIDRRTDSLHMCSLLGRELYLASSRTAIPSGLDGQVDRETGLHYNNWTRSERKLISRLRHCRLLQVK